MVADMHVAPNTAVTAIFGDEQPRQPIEDRSAEASDEQGGHDHANPEHRRVHAQVLAQPSHHTRHPAVRTAPAQLARRR